MRTSLLIGLLCSTLTGCGDDTDEPMTGDMERDGGGGSAGDGGSSGASGGGGSAGDGGTSAGGSAGDGGMEADAGGAPPMLEDGPGAFDPDFETSDDFFTRTSGRVEGLSVSPHGEVQIWYSTNIESVIDDPMFTAPEGTVAIKTQDRDGVGEVQNIMVMIKLAEGADPDRGDWLYEQRSATGKLQGENPGFCKDCHNQWPETDRLRGMSLKD